MSFDRKISNYSDGLSPAYVPSAYYTSDDLKQPVEKIIKDLRWKPTVEFLHSLSEDIKNHVEMRIQLLFIQCLLVRETGFNLSPHGTVAQMGKAAVIKRDIPDAEKDDYDSESCHRAAHSSTAPSLKYSRADGKEIHVLAGSCFDNSQNSTVLVPKVVNDVDSMLDGTNSSLKKLRGKVIEILNQTSSKKDPQLPDQSLFLFTKALTAQIKSSLAENKDGMREFVLLNYLEVSIDYQKKLESQTTRITLVQKMCFKVRGKQIIDNRFYAKIKNDMTMHLKPELVVSLRRSDRIAKIDLKTELEALGKTATRYEKLCLKDQPLRVAGKKCLAGTVSRIDFEKIVQETIGDEFKKAPQKIDLLTAHILKKLSPGH